MTNSADPEQLASSDANWSGSTLFAKTGHVVFSKRRVNPFMLSGFFYHKPLDRWISSKRDVWLINIITMFSRNSCTYGKQKTLIRSCILSHTIYWNNPISTLGMPGYVHDLDISREKRQNYFQTVETSLDAALCGIWSGSALFANYPFWGHQIKMG